MPAHIGFLSKLKIPLAFCAQFQKEAIAVRDYFADKLDLGEFDNSPPNEWVTARNVAGVMSPADIYRAKEADAQRRNHTVKNYKDYRNWLNRFGPNRQNAPNGRDPQGRWVPVDGVEWNLYLKPGTAFDDAVKAVLKAGYSINFVARKSNAKEVKRLEAKRKKGAPSVTLWSKDGGGNEQLFG